MTGNGKFALNSIIQTIYLIYISLLCYMIEFEWNELKLFFKTKKNHDWIKMDSNDGLDL